MHAAYGLPIVDKGSLGSLCRCWSLFLERDLLGDRLDTCFGAGVVCFAAGCARHTDGTKDPPPSIHHTAAAGQHARRTAWISSAKASGRGRANADQVAHLLTPAATP